MLPSQARGLSLINDKVLKINMVRINVFYQDIKLFPISPLYLITIQTLLNKTH